MNNAAVLQQQNIAAKTQKPDMTMQRIKVKGQNILLLSDTHSYHRLIDVPKDIQMVIHSDDVCNAGKLREILDFFNWYNQSAIPHKIFVHGNHDLPFELEPELSKAIVPKSVIWLNDESIVIGKINITGISAFPFYNGVAYGNEVDILVSHYPPSGILDHGCGSEEVRNFVLRASPGYHVFGHNHSGYGKTEFQNIQFINASLYHELCQE